MKRLVIFTIFYLVAMHVVAQAPITHTLPVPKKKSTSVNSTLQINYIVKAKDYFKKGNYDQASKMLSNMDKWNSEAYELAGDVCYLWNATLWYTYYEKASEMGSASAKQKLHRNIRSNVISVIGRTINYVYSSRDKYSNTNIHSIADVESLKRDAENGNAEAQFNLGRMYEYGDGVSLDYSKATYWYDKLKENRHVYSTINLAWLFSEGLGVEKDEQKAFNLYMVAANKNMDDAIHNIGLSYEYGKGVRQDKKEAIKWFRKNMDRYLDTYGPDFSTKEYYNLVYAQQIQDGQVLTINACYRLYKYLHNLSGNHDTEIDLIIKRAEVIGIDDIDWDSVNQLEHNGDAKRLVANYSGLSIGDYQDDIARVDWMLYPDGVYFADGDGFGMEDNDEVNISAYIDTQCRVVVKFQDMEDGEKRRKLREEALATLNHKSRE